MKNKLISLVIGASIVVSSNMVVFAQKVSVDELYKNAFNSVVTCQKDKTQSSVNAAREKINLLFNTGASWAIGEFSKQVDQIQHPILVKIVDNITGFDKLMTQKVVNDTRLLIKDLPNQEWRNSYSSALDGCQQKLLSRALGFFNDFSEKRTLETREKCLSSLTELSTSLSSDVVKWALDYTSKAMKIELNGMDASPELKKVEELYNKALKSKDYKDIIECKNVMNNTCGMYLNGNTASKEVTEILNKMIKDLTSISIDYSKVSYNPESFGATVLNRGEEIKLPRAKKADEVLLVVNGSRKIPGGSDWVDKILKEANSSSVEGVSRKYFYYFNNSSKSIESVGNLSCGYYSVYYCNKNLEVVEAYDHTYYIKDDRITISSQDKTSVTLSFDLNKIKSGDALSFYLTTFSSSSYELKPYGLSTYSEFKDLKSFIEEAFADIHPCCIIKNYEISGNKVKFNYDDKYCKDDINVSNLQYGSHYSEY